MSLTFADIKDRLKQYDETTLLELLDVSAEELVEAFEHRIEERYELLEAMLTDDNED